MNKLGYIISLFVLTMIICDGTLCQETRHFAIQCEVTGLRNQRGKLHLALFGGMAGGKGFPGSDKDALKVQTLQADTAIAAPVIAGKPQVYTLKCSFADLPPGRYAIAVYHDENSNGKLDTYWYGKPREGAAASNNPHPSFRAPNFKESSFELSDSQTIALKMWYP